MVVDIIRKMIGDNPTYHEETGITLKNDTYYIFPHYPLFDTPVMKVNAVTITPTYKNESGVAIFASAQSGTLSTEYRSVWFTDETINQMTSYISIEERLKQVDTDKYVFEIPKYPVRYTIKDDNGIVSTVSFDETTMQFTMTAINPIISGIAVDLYNTVGTLLLLKASNPQMIRKEFMSFSNWGEYPAVAQGLREQANYWFTFSGK